LSFTSLVKPPTHPPTPSWWKSSPFQPTCTGCRISPRVFQSEIFASANPQISQRCFGCSD
jgi:hypothetical protein